jgi:hypothetical protein
LSGGSSKNPPDKSIKTLSDQGIDKHLADRARNTAAMTEDKFEASVPKKDRVAQKPDLKNACRTQEEIAENVKT